MVLVYNDMQISKLEDIQKLKVKDLREILRSNSEATGGIKADLVLKVYAIFVRHVLRLVRISSKVAIILVRVTRIQRKIAVTSSTMKL